MFSLTFLVIPQSFRRQFLLPSKSGILACLWTRSMNIASGDIKRQLNEKADGSSPKLKIDLKLWDKFPTVVESVRKKKVALLLAYCGRDYYGMQNNSERKSIEGELLSAMVKAGLISKENCETPLMMQFQRASRTDKGVSAARQVVSFRMHENALNEDLVDKINAHLPPEVKVLGMKRTPIMFSSKSWCNSRTYLYTLPTFAFTPVTEITSKNYHITDDVIKRLNSVLELFKGTHNFHNFTSKRKPDEASVNRCIVKFESGKPFVADGLEFLTITVKGKGFMLNQIRKMIGITILVMRDWIGMSLIKTTFTHEKVNIPVAPSVGLLLEQVDYDRYNKECAIDGPYDRIEWDDLEETIEHFKSQIRLSLLAAEKQEKSMFQWLTMLPLYKFEVRNSSSSQGKTEFGRAKIAIENENRAKERVDEMPGSEEAEIESPVESGR